MNVITALNNQAVQDIFKKNCPEFTFLTPDISYQEALLEALSIHRPDSILINISIEGDSNPCDFITNIRKINSACKIVLIMKEENQEYINWLASKAIYDSFVDGQCSFEDIRNALAISRKARDEVKSNNVEESGNVSKQSTIPMENESCPTIGPTSQKNSGNKVKFVEKEKIITVEKIVRVGFKKIILPIIGSTEIACEMAYSAAKITDLKVALINLDNVQGMLKIYLGIASQKSSSPFTFLEESKNGKIPCEATKELCFHTAFDNLNILDFANYPEKLLAQNPKELVDMLLACYTLFDITIISIPWYSPYIKHVSCISENVVLVTEAYNDKIETTLSLAKSHLANSIPPENQLLLFNEYNKETCIPESALKERFGDRYLGRIFYDASRCCARNRDSLEGYYISLCYPYLKSQYSKILIQFDIYETAKFPSTNGKLTSLFQKRAYSDHNDFDEENKRHDLLFALKEAYGILSYVSYIFIKAISKLIYVLLSIFKPIGLIIFILVILILLITESDPIGILKNLINVLSNLVS